MGSFTSAEKILNDDTYDDTVFFSETSTCSELVTRCELELSDWRVFQVYKMIPRTLVDVGPPGKDRIRIMQWNILAQALAEGSDKFVQCPDGALQWDSRRWQLLGEMALVQPDVLCLQEVDHFRFFQRALASIGYKSFFYPKPDSPCLYVPENNGPDGCAMFVNTSRFEVLYTKTRSLEIWGCQTNQVAICCKLRRLSDGADLWVATTHLKARSGTVLASLRREQGCDLLDFLRTSAGDDTPLVLTGDMNAGPTEPVHTVLKGADLESVYDKQVPSYTSWTIREDGEQCNTLDYILYRPNSFHIERLQRIPTEEEIGAERVPSFKYPSDHFALVADLVLHDP